MWLKFVNRSKSRWSTRHANSLSLSPEFPAFNSDVLSLFVNINGINIVKYIVITWSQWVSFLIVDEMQTTYIQSDIPHSIFIVETYNESTFIFILYTNSIIHSWTRNLIWCLLCAATPRSDHGSWKIQYLVATVFYAQVIWYCSSC